MIIFDLRVLADDSHRRHFIDPNSINHLINPQGKYYNVFTEEVFKPDYAAYYAAADKDEPIKDVIKIFDSLRKRNILHVWSDTPHINIEFFSKEYDLHRFQVRERPDGDTTPWHELKKRWILENMQVVKGSKVAVEMTPRHLKIDETLEWKNKIELAFEPAGSPMIPIWKKYGVTVMEVHS